jgi:hypothetical protein
VSTEARSYNRPQCFELLPLARTAVECRTRVRATSPVRAGTATASPGRVNVDGTDSPAGSDEQCNFLEGLAQRAQENQ